MTDEVRKKLWHDGCYLGHTILSLNNLLQNEINPDDLPGWNTSVQEFREGFENWVESIKHHSKAENR